MKKVSLVISLIFVVLASGCAQTKDFSYGLEQMNDINSKYNATFNSYPGDVDKIDLIVNSYKELKKLKLDNDREAFNLFLDYQILNFRSNRDFVNSLKYGDVGTTRGGFVCKSRPIIIETVGFKNASAIRGFEAVGNLKNFIDNYPEKAKLLNLSRKNVIFLNATYYELSKDANSDSDTINEFCPENLALEKYREWFMKNTNLSDDYINKMDYNTAVSIWKKEVGVS